MSNTARVIEVFPSIQGEGIYIGRRHLFVRFWNCNMACHYCDTDYKGPYREVTQEALLGEVEEFVRRDGPFHAVSLTGGEPLLWVSFLKGWLPKLKALGARTYLETNGTLEPSFREVADWIDIIAMDLKPPSATADRSVWTEHEAFLRGARASAAELFVKIVVTADTLESELRQSFDLVARADRRIPVVLQPVTPWGPVRQTPSEEQIARWARAGEETLADVRVLPQIHRILGVR
jgi:organic radical activating enzyme